MKRQVVIGLDVGTSSLKATVADAENGSIIKNSRHLYDADEIVPGVLPVSVYENAVRSVLRDLSGEFSIKSVGVSTQMYSVCREIPQGRQVYQWNSLWNRTREKEELLRKLPLRSGCPVDTIYPSYKLYTIDDESRPSFLPFGLKEHLLKYLTGELATDYSTASASGLFDIRNREWNSELLDTLGYSLKDMPVVKRHDETVGFLKKEFMEDPLQSTLVVPGLGDGVSASYACSDISGLCGNLGTSMAVRTLVDELPESPDTSLWTYAVDEKRYVLGGISPNGCSILNWAKDAGWNSDMELSQSGGLMFFPWLHGERTPYWTSDLRGTFIGLDINTDKHAIDTAVTKSVGFTFAGLVETLQGYIKKDAVLLTAGGGMHSNSLMEVIMGTVGFRTGILNEYDYLASLGAAMSAAKALGTSIGAGSVYLDKIIEPTGRFLDEYRSWRETANRLAEFYSERSK